ncbi:hypothetical protein GCM10007901_17520 [Dyella acidisoli]|uniref:Uncharacterized protein n=1 Tax=Dyella acidisoli TaxID=1867834 RepID=A0ABQ5XM87_9GAMM|nr:hypothetical protein GCM10007901_17520 [Dyella acidisoli]
MREDGSFASEFKGETGQMMSAAIDVLHKIRLLREEPSCIFGLSSDEFDLPERIELGPSVGLAHPYKMRWARVRMRHQLVINPVIPNSD